MPTGPVYNSGARANQKKNMKISYWEAFWFIWFIGVSVVDSSITVPQLLNSELPEWVWGVTKLGNCKTAHTAAATSWIGLLVLVLLPSVVCRDVGKFGMATIPGIGN